MTGALVAAAVVQAIAAVVIAVFTVKLSNFTESYVAEMKAANDLQAQANVLTREAVKVQSAQNAPWLLVRPRVLSETTSERVGEIQVRNEGRSVAAGIALDTTWGPASLNEGLGPGTFSNITIRLPVTPASAFKAYFEVRSMTFTDPLGQEWKQKPGEPPERVLGQ